MISKCRVCENENLLFADTVAKGGYGPRLLPGTGTFKSAYFRIVVCTDCGFTHWFVRPEDLDKVRNSKHFKPISQAR